jgi:hypothetical protein
MDDPSFDVSFPALLARQVSRTRRALPSLPRMRAVAKWPLLAQPAAAKADGRFARQVPLLPIRVLQNNVTFDAQRAVGPDCNVNRFLCHETSVYAFQNTSRAMMKIQLLPLAAR